MNMEIVKNINTYESSTLQMKGRWKCILMSGSNVFIPRNETAPRLYFPNRIIMFCLLISTFMYLWVIYV
jgi:hypothetical protein